MAQSSTTAFTEAERHTRRVRRLRWLLPLISLVLALAFAGITYLRSLFADIEIGPVELEGNALVLQQPKIAGVDKHQRAYEVTAQTAKQSIAEPKKVELSKLEAKMQLAGNGWARITSDSGLLNGETEHVALAGNIHVTSSHGYAMQLDRLQIDTRAGTMASDSPVTATQGENRISADRLKIIDSGEVIRFEGNVRAELNPKSAERAP